MLHWRQINFIHRVARATRWKFNDAEFQALLLGKCTPHSNSDYPGVIQRKSILACSGGVAAAAEFKGRRPVARPLSRPPSTGSSRTSGTRGFHCDFASEFIEYLRVRPRAACPYILSLAWPPVFVRERLRSPTRPPLSPPFSSRLVSAFAFYSFSHCQCPSLCPLSLSRSFSPSPFVSLSWNFSPCPPPPPLPVYPILFPASAAFHLAPFFWLEFSSSPSRSRSPRAFRTLASSPI